MKANSSIILLAIYFFNLIVYSQEKNTSIPKRIYTTKSISSFEPPSIDGLINDEVWDIVPWDSEFTEWRPDEGSTPTYQTKFKIVYDAKYLYIAVRAIDDEPDNIVKRLSRRDGFEGDWVEINIDSYHDLRTGFSFTISAAGVKGDEFISNNGNNWDSSWNPIWYVKTNIDQEGWTAELKIPLTQLRFSKADEQVWGLQVQRRFFRAAERSLWQRVPLDAPGWISEFGELHGLKGLKPQKQLEIQPFTVGKYETFEAEEGNPFRDGTDRSLNAGIDAKIGITNDLTLDLTINPDFGQVEADPAAIALDGFEIFFREQRPFFVENKNIFDYEFSNNQDNLFFSRRIGRSPQGSANTEEGEHSDTPSNTTILGAAKFSGKTKNGWSIGILESMTSREYAEIDNNGTRREERIEPLTNYFVGRVQKDLNERNTFIGGIFTATNREKLPEQLNFLRNNAYTAGIDAKHQWRNRDFYIEGNVIMSHVKGSKESIEETQRSLTHLFQREDAAHVNVDPNKTSLSGTGGKFEGGKQGGGHWRYNAGVSWKSPELELNDIGFLRQADVIRQYANLRWRTTKATGKFRRIAARLSQFSTYDFDGNYNRIQYEFNAEANFKSNWWVDVGVGHKPRIYTNTFLQGGPRWHFSDENFVFAFFGTDNRKKLRGRVGTVRSSSQQDNFSFFRLTGRLTYQPTNNLKISLNPEFRDSPSKTQYVTQQDYNSGKRYILGEIDNKRFSTSIRLNYTINPNLTLQYYGEPFIFRARYKNFKYVTNAAGDNLYDRFQQYDDNQISFDGDDYSIDETRDGNTDYSFSNPDFSFVQFRSNLVARWEYIPGSEIFLVWSQGITGNVDTSDNLFTGLENGILNRKPENIFLIKATYRFVL